MRPARRNLLAALVVAGAAIKLFVFQLTLQPASGGSSPLASAILSVGTALVLFSLPLFLPQPARQGAVVAFSVVVGLLVFSNALHFRYWSDVISVADLDNLRMARIMFASARAKVRAGDLLYFADSLIALILLRSALREARNDARVTGAKRRHAMAMLLAGTTLSAPYIGDFFLEGERMFSGVKRQIAAKVGIVYYQFGDIVTNWRGVTPMDSAALHTHADSVSCATLALQHRGDTAAAHFGAAKGQNLILVSAESLQQWLIGLTIDGQLVAPNLTRLAAEGMRFPEFHSETHLGVTSDAEFAALNSLHPLPWGSVAFTHPDNHFRGLPWILGKNGFVTVSAAGEPGNQWNMERMHPAQGFQQSWFEDSYRFSHRIAGWVPDIEFLEQTATRLGAVRQPFFAFLITSSMHHPYSVPSPKRGGGSAAPAGAELRAYLDAARYFDDALGAFLSRLRTTGLLDRSILVVYGDHGAFLDFTEELRKLAGQRGSGDLARRRAITRLPLIVRLPHAEDARAIGKVGGHTDIAPTLLSLLGIKSDVPMLGDDLLSDGPGLAVFRDGSFVDQTIYLINAPGDIRHSRCYLRTQGVRVSCAPYSAQRERARARLDLSDAIVREDLLPLMMQSSACRPASQSRGDAPILH